VELGALGIVRKDEAEEIVIHAIEEVHAGHAWLDGDTMGRVLARLRQPCEGTHEADPEALMVSSLTKREREIITLVCHGCKNRQVADRLLMSEGTVRNCLTAIYGKLDVSNRFGLIVFAARHSL
jgi:DNA-binding NarL/FixJ family response regulator